jgi:hypothetical protein
VSGSYKAFLIELGCPEIPHSDSAYELIDPPEVTLVATQVSNMGNKIKVLQDQIAVAESSGTQGAEWVRRAKQSLSTYTRAFSLLKRWVAKTEPLTSKAAKNLSDESSRELLLAKLRVDEERAKQSVAREERLLYQSQNGLARDGEIAKLRRELKFLRVMVSLSLDALRSESRRADLIPTLEAGFEAAAEWSQTHSSDLLKSQYYDYLEEGRQRGDRKAA